MNKRVLIAIPTSGSLHRRLVEVLASLRSKPASQGVDWTVCIASATPVSANRNAIVKAFLASEEKYDFLIMIDDDIVPPDNLFDLIRHDKDILSGNCHGLQTVINGKTIAQGIKNVACVWVEGKNRVTLNNEQEDAGLIEVHCVGTGCICIKREVLEAMAEKDIPWFNFRYDKYDNIVLSEDYDFCEKAKDLGFTIWHDGNMRCAHFKQVGI